MSEAQKGDKQAWLDRMKVGASKEIIQGLCTCRLSLLHSVSVASAFAAHAPLFLSS